MDMDRLESFVEAVRTQRLTNIYYTVVPASPDKWRDKPVDYPQVLTLGAADFKDKYAKDIISVFRVQKQKLVDTVLRLLEGHGFRLINLPLPANPSEPGFDPEYYAIERAIDRGIASADDTLRQKRLEKLRERKDELLLAGDD